MIYYFSYFLNILSITINIYFYFFVKNLKKQNKILKQCNLEYNTYKITILKNISFILIPLLSINLFISIHKYISNLPLLGGIYSFLLTSMIFLQLFCYFRIIKKFKKTNCFKKLNLNNKIYNQIYNHQYKIFFIYIIINYYTLFYT